MIKMTFLQRPQKRHCRLIKFLKVDDAIASTLAAKKSGVVVGGGRALYDIGR